MESALPRGVRQIAVGKRITLKSVTGNGRPRSVWPTILTAEPGVELRWKAGIPGVVGGEHSFALSPVNDGTRLVQSETFRGILVPLSGGILARAEPGYDAMNKALKNRVEAARAGGRAESGTT